MGRITLPGLPESVADWVRTVLSGSAGDVVWKLLMLTLFIGVAAVLLIGGGAFGAAIGGILLGTLLSDDVRALVLDVWNRDWAEVEAPW